MYAKKPMLGRGAHAADITGDALPRAIESFRVEGSGRYAIVDTSTPELLQISCVWRPDLPTNFRYARKLPTPRVVPKRLIGFALATPVTRSDSEADCGLAGIGKIEVDAAHRSVGIGCMLLEATERKLLREAHRRRCTRGVRVYAYADPTDACGRVLSGRAMRFYMQQGYRVAGIDMLGIRMERLVTTIRGAKSLRKTCIAIKQRYRTPNNATRRIRDEEMICKAIIDAYSRADYEKHATRIQHEFESSLRERGLGEGRLNEKQIEHAQRETHKLPSHVDDDVYEYESDPPSPPVESD